MNPTPSSRPRFVCRVTRLWSTVAGGAGARHAAGCADCRAYFAAAERIDLALRRGAPAWRETSTPAPSSGFEQRLLNATSAPPEPKPSRASHLGWLAATAVTAAVAVAFFRPPGGSPGRALDADVALLTASVGHVSRGLVETVIPTTGALVADNPLQREFGALYADARSAVSFLALNFLPVTDTTATGSEPARPF